MEIVLLDPWPVRVLDPLGLGHVTRGEVGHVAELERVDRHELANEIVFHIAIHPLDHGDDRDQEHDANRHPDQSKEALELLYPDLTQGESNGVDERHFRRSSVSISPSLRTITRPACAA